MKKLLIAIGCLCCMSGAAQFNPLQSQYMLNPVVFNPAYAGAPGMLSTSVAYRKQWSGINGSPETFSFAAHMPMRNPHFNAGLIASQDNIAVLHHTQVWVLYAYRFRLPRFAFAAGVAPGLVFERSNWNEVSTNLPGDAAFDGVSERSLSYRVDLGVYGSGERFFIGLSGRAAFSKTGPSGFTDQPWMLYTGYRFGRKEFISVTPSVLARMIPNSYYQADLNLLVYLRDRIGFGLSYRPGEAIAGLADVRLNEQLRFGYSYDLAVSHLRSYTTGSHELTLRYEFHYTVHANSPRNL